MPKYSGSPQLIPVRRKDRAVSDEIWIEQLLASSPFGVLATVRDGQPHVNMNIFVYDSASKSLYFHTAKAGQTRENVELNGRVSFCVSEMGRLLPAIHALEFSVEYAGVVVFGVASIISDAAEARHALQLLLDKYAPHLKSGQHYRAITDEELERTTAYRVQIEKWSGKKKIAPTDFLGAFRYGEPATPAWADWREREATT